MPGFTGATLHDIAAAYFRPIVQALSGPEGRGRPYLGVLVHLAVSPPCELHEWIANAIQRAHDGLHESLRAVLPDVPDAELRFRPLLAFSRLPGSRSLKARGEHTLAGVGCAAA